ncbi:MAG: hypothetical protein AAF202_03310, partial [Pseudomonadota bacterium]
VSGSADITFGIAEQVGDFSDLSLKISSLDDYIVFQAYRDTEQLSSYLCHFHNDGAYHCDLLAAGEVYEPALNEILQLAPVQMNELLMSIGAIGTSDPAIWAWVVVGAVTFYLAKKVINKAVLGQYLAPEIDHHSHFFQSEKSMQKQVAEKEVAIQKAIPGLLDVVKRLSAEGPKVGDSEAADIASKEITEDIKHIVHGLVHKASSGCGHHHHGHKHEHHESHSTCGSQKKAAQETLQSGGVIRFSKTLGNEFYREFIRPVGVLLKSGYEVLFDRWHRKQIGALARVEANRVRAETNLPFAIAFLTSLVGLKAFGEFLESLVVGPYHAFCQISDAAVLVVGMSVWGSYHCLRQAVQYGQVTKVHKASFWKAMAKSFRQRLRGTTAKHEVLLRGADDDWTAYFLSLRFLSREFKTVIRKKNNLGQLTNDQAAQASRWLGDLNRSIEDQSFLKTLEQANTEIDKEAWLQSVRDWLGSFENVVSLTMDWNESKAQQLQQSLSSRSCKAALK